MKRKTRKHWYYVTEYECPLCGCGDTVRERRYGRRPKRRDRRHAFETRYDYCDFDPR